MLLHFLAERYNAHDVLVQGAPLNESDHCGDPPLLLAAGNGASLRLLFAEVWHAGLATAVSMCLPHSRTTIENFM